MTEAPTQPAAVLDENAAIRARVAELVAEAPPLTAEQRRAAVRAFANTSTTHLLPVPVQAEREPEPEPGVDRSTRSRRAAARIAARDPFAAMVSDESQMADRIDEAFGGAS